MGATLVKVLIGSMVVVATLGVTGCNKKQAADKPPIGQMGNTLNDGRFGTNATLDCEDGKSLNIGGSKNTYTVKGRCASVIIGGDDNRMVFATVENELTVAGLNNTVTYRDGDPTVTDLGTGNNISRG